MSLYVVERKSVVRNLILVLALFIVLASSSILSVSASGIASPQPVISQRTKYPITLRDPHAQEDGSFGWSVAISGSLAIVGAIGDGPAGHAYVFNATTGKVINTLTSPNRQTGEVFGGSVAINDHLAIVSAPNETPNGHIAAGRAYVYNATTWNVIETLTSPNAQFEGWFGSSIAISGKLAIVGAPGEAVNGTAYAGHAYVYNATTWKVIKTLSSPNAQDYGYFGWSVAISSGLAVVGAYGENASGYIGAGHAYVYNATTWNVIKTLTSPNAQDDGSFGSSVAISGNLATVGAPWETGDGYWAAGNAYVFNAITGKLIKKLTSAYVQEYGWFGSSAAMSSGLAIVGADGENSGAGNVAVYNASSWKLIETLSSPHPIYEGSFGTSVWISGKLAIVGAPYETEHGFYYCAGNSYVFKLPTASILFPVQNHPTTPCD